MLYQPTFPSPYLETIDVTNPAGNVFKCLINPKNKVVGYEITVLSNIDNSPVCKIKGYLETVTEKQVQKKSYSLNNGTSWTEFESIPDEDSVLPVVGNFTDESWLEVVIPSSSAVNLGLTNDNEYKWNIILYEEKPSVLIEKNELYEDTDKGFSDYDVAINLPTKSQIGMYIKIHDEIRELVQRSQPYSDGIGYKLQTKFNKKFIKGTPCEIFSDYLSSFDYYFKTRKMSVLDFNVPDKINSLSHTFSASISRESNIYEANISSYKFELYLGADLIDTSENVYSNDITYTYNGFISDNNYTIKLTVITEDGETLVEERDFKVSYNVSTSTFFIESEVQKSVNGIYLNFDGQVAINGYLEGGQDVVYGKHKNLNSDAPETNNSIGLSVGQTLHWDSINDTRDLSIPTDGTTLIHWHGTLGYVGKIIELSNTKALNEKITIGYDSKSFYYKIGTNDMVYYSPYTNGVANAIAGRDAYSTCGQIVSYTVTDGVVQVVVAPSEIIREGMYISVNGERKKIIAVSEDKTMLTLEGAFDNAVVGRNDYSISGQVISYSNIDDIVQITLPQSENIKENMYISINGERKLITKVIQDEIIDEESGEVIAATVATLVEGFTSVINEADNYFVSDEDNYVVYDELICYTFFDEEKVYNNDIFIENDMGYNYWWLIVITQNEVKFIKTQRYTDTIVKAVSE